MNTPLSIPDLLDRDYIPDTTDAFCGPARRIAGHVDRVIAQRRPKGYAMKVLFKGEPGTGKSALAKYFIRGMAGVPFDPWNVHKYSGTDISIDRVREFANELAMRPLTGGYRILWIEEADKIPANAQVRFLILMDDLPRHNAVVCTSNSTLADFEERFQTRFVTHDVDGPGITELIPFLMQFTDDRSLAEAVAQCATVNDKANVRQALNDLDNALLAREAA